MIKCKWCGEETNLPIECESCWELRCRIEENISLAQKILHKILSDSWDALGAGNDDNEPNQAYGADE